MDDRAAGITRAPCNLPKEAQGIEPCTADGRALHLDRTQLEAIAVVADDPERGLLLLSSSIWADCCCVWVLIETGRC
jgi:hypothetical protein